MARIVENDKGFKVIALSVEDAFKLGWGNVCMNCNNLIKGEMYYIAVLNDVMDLECYNKWYKRAKLYADDKYYEDKNFNYYKEKLGL